MKIKELLNPKKPFLWVSVISAAVIIAGVCFFVFYWLSPARSIAIIGGADGPTSVIVATQNNNPVFEATVLEINGNTMLVEPSPESAEIKSADKISVPIDNIDKNTVNALKKGSEIIIEYDGMLQETYPAGISALYDIYIIE